MPEDRQFVGFDAYKKAMDCLKPGDIAIFATPPAFRWVHFTYAIEKGLNVFMEKPVTVDGPTSKRMLKLAEEATAKNLKVGVGLMSRHSRALRGTGQAHPGRRDRRHHPACAATACTGRSASSPRCPSPPASASCSTRSSASTASSGPAAACYSDFYIHIIDHLLLDEERLAGQGPGAGRPPLSPEPRRRHLRRPELRHLLGGIHVRRRHQVHLRRPLHDRLQRHLLELRPRHQGHRRSPPRAATAGCPPASTRARTRRART